MTGFEPVPRGLAGLWAAVTPHSLRHFSFQRTHSRRVTDTHPSVWRQRQDSNPDPRALEARMLPVTPRCRFEDTPSPCPGPWPSGLEAKTKKGLLGDRP